MSVSESPSWRADFISVSTRPGVTEYQAGLTVKVVLVRSNWKGVAAASAAVVPAKDSLSTAICASMRRSQRPVSRFVNAWSEITWKTVSTVTEPAGSVAASASSAYSLAFFDG